MSHILGIDYGTRRVGVAISDETSTIAVPKAVLPNDDGLVKEIKAFCETHAVEKIVIGHSQTHRGEDNPVMERIRPFAKTLETSINVPVEFESEFLTTAHAARTPENQARLDASAAALILQSYLDRTS